MKGVQPTPDWLAQFNRNFDGVAGPVALVTIDGKPYRLSYVCKPEDCAARRFAVLFEPDAQHAYGALGGKDSEPAFFGDPPKDLEDALDKALGR